MLLSSSNRKYPPLPLLSYYSVVVCLRCLLHHILPFIAYTFWENREFVFIIIVQFMMSANSRMRFGLQIVLVCLYSTPSHYHHWTSLSEGIELMLDIFLSSVWVILSIFSQLSNILYVGLCVFRLPISLVMIERIYISCLIIIIIKSEVWTSNHCLGLGHETMVCTVCLSIFLWILLMEDIHLTLLIPWFSLRMNIKPCIITRLSYGYIMVSSAPLPFIWPCFSVVHNPWDVFYISNMPVHIHSLRNQIREG